MQDRIYQYEPLWGEWKVDELIGEGSFGKVYKVKRTEFGETNYSAVKIISIPQNESEIKHAYSEGMNEQSVKTYFENFVAGFLKEIRLMTSIKGNTNIVSLEDYKIVEKKDGIGWDILIRMELLKSFVDYMSEKTLSKRDVIKLGIDMCKALELCQKTNIIHRDIKPDNIFVSPHGDFKLGDFGIARQIEKTTSGLSKKGTFTYMAPEVYKGEAYNSTVDIYSLGLVLYRLLNNNRTPFLPDYPAQITHTSREESLIKRISGEPFPMPVNADGRLAEIVLKACSFKPIDRYENPVLMREALESIQYQVDEAPLIYPMGDKIENKSVNYASTNKSIKEVGNTESIFGVYNSESLKAGEATESVFGESIPTPICNLATEDGKTESIFKSPLEPLLDIGASVINIGSFIQIGKYNNNPILWRCVDIDNNGLLILSDRIITLKSFDAKGDHKYLDGSVQEDSNCDRRHHGSNLWVTSNIRSWLNSTAPCGKVEWVDNCPPNQNAVWSNFNEYANERGFLSETNFTFNERSAIKRVTQKSILNEIDIAKVETRGNYPHIFQMKIADVSQKNYSAYQQDVTDKMFLLGVDQICRIYKNKSIFGTDYHLCKPTQKAVDISEYKYVGLNSETPWYYWLRTPCSDSGFPAVVIIISPGSVMGYDRAIYGNIGIRPAFYLNSSTATFKSGNGTEENPYIVK